MLGESHQLPRPYSRDAIELCVVWQISCEVGQAQSWLGLFEQPGGCGSADVCHGYHFPVATSWRQPRYFPRRTVLPTRHFSVCKTLITH